MTEQWRLIDMRIENAPTQMAIDEAIAIARLKHDTPNTIRVYRWQPSAVSIGYFQSIEKEVNLEACKTYSVDVIRRITGGGAVYHDYGGEITYSLVAPENHPNMPRDILESYGKICGAIVNGLRMFEVLRVSDAKISDKIIQAVEERVTNIRRYLERDVSFDEARKTLIKGFEESFDMELVPGELTEEEETLVGELVEKYSSHDWVFQR